MPSDMMVHICNQHFGRLRKEEREFLTSLSCIARPYLKKKMGLGL
jgi:regulator of replication initiation timing